MQLCIPVLCQPPRSHSIPFVCLLYAKHVYHRQQANASRPRDHSSQTLHTTSRDGLVLSQYTYISNAAQVRGHATLPTEGAGLTAKY